MTGSKLREILKFVITYSAHQVSKQVKENINAREKTQNRTEHGSAPGRHFKGIQNKRFASTNTTILVY
jgi:hypothetical protein